MNHIHRESKQEIVGRSPAYPISSSIRVVRVCECSARSSMEAGGWSEWRAPRVSVR